MSLPTTHRALVVRDVNVEPEIEIVNTPECLPGTAILQVLVAPIVSYMKDIYLGNSRNYPFPLPIVPGTSCIGRVAALASDATSPNVSVGTLVYFDCVVRSRMNDNSGSPVFLSAIHEGHSAAAKSLMANGGFKDGSFAEFMRVPLENIFVCNEQKLISQPSPEGHSFAYNINDLAHIGRFSVPYGGLRSINLLPGETILIGPATGPFGAGAVVLALSLGAKVIAWGRDRTKMDSLKTKMQSIQDTRFKHMIEVVVLQNNDKVDTNRIIEANQNKRLDAALDISPPAAAGSTYIKSAILSLRHAGRMSLMGGISGDVAIPHVFVMHQDITIKGKWMYEREDVLSLLALIECGVVRLDHAGAAMNVVGQFPLSEWKQAWNIAYERNRPGEVVVINPNGLR